MYCYRLIFSIYASYPPANCSLNAAHVTICAHAKVGLQVAADLGYC
jgi:hypothetical protein